MQLNFFSKDIYTFFLTSMDEVIEIKFGFSYLSLNIFMVTA